MLKVIDSANCNRVRIDETKEILINKKKKLAMRVVDSFSVFLQRLFCFQMKT